MSTNGAISDLKYPFVHLEYSLCEVRDKVLLKNYNKIVVSVLFDAYRFNFVAPDQLLAVLAVEI